MTVVATTCGFCASGPIPKVAWRKMLILPWLIWPKASEVIDQFQSAVPAISKAADNRPKKNRTTAEVSALNKGRWKFMVYL
jgi:hypothetical protein